MPDLFNTLAPLQGQRQFLPDSSQQQPKHKGGRHNNRQRQGNKAPFSADGPVFDRTKSTIVVENIPEENFSEDQVRGFFAQFGTILEVSMQPYKRLAIVKFSNWASANAAYQSPKVIFDNRFVKVFWYKENESSLPASGVSPEQMKIKSANGYPLADVDNQGTQPEIDMEDFVKKQEEKQKAFEEKRKKIEELERQRQDLEKRQKELLAKRQEEKARLEAKLARRNGSVSGGSESDSRLSKPTSQTEALRAQLAALEAEAREMGLDPDADIDAPASWPARGGFGRGRGRGGWRGAPPYYNPRGTYGYRGAPRGRVNVHAAYAAYSLDNRPKKVVLTGVDFTVAEKDEKLRQYLFVSIPY
jgi:polyhydroxyalkanoate synthesis regulator phasin